MYRQAFARNGGLKAAITQRIVLRRYGLHDKGTALPEMIRTHAVKQIGKGAVFGLGLRRGERNNDKVVVLFARFEELEGFFRIAVKARLLRSKQGLRR